MSLRVLGVQTLAIGFPVASLVALKLNLLPVLWLGAPDAVLTAGVFVGLLSQGGPWLRLACGLLAASAAVLSYNLWPSQSVLAFPILLNVFLAHYFQQSLAANREPIISRFARFERGGRLPPEVADYTRQLTGAWRSFFWVMAAELSVLAATATVETYLLFANTLNFFFVAAFFLVEYHYRRKRFPQYPQKPILHFVRRLLDGGWLATEQQRRSTE
jgi:uncharacterized membrane protein